MFIEEVCFESIVSLMYYIRYGLPPGRFCETLLLGDYEIAHRSAHRYIRHTVRYMIGLVQTFPARCRTDCVAINAWIEHNGLSGLSEIDKIKFLFSCDTWIIELLCNSTK